MTCVEYSIRDYIENNPKLNNFINSRIFTIGYVISKIVAIVISGIRKKLATFYKNNYLLTPTTCQVKNYTWMETDVVDKATVATRDSISECIGLLNSAPETSLAQTF